MDLDPLKVDSNFFKENSAVDSSRSFSYVQITKRLDKTVLTVDYEARSSKRVTIGDIGKVLMTEMDKRSDEVLGITKYFFGQDKGYVKIKMAKPIDVKTRFGSNHGKAQDEFVSQENVGNLFKIKNTMLKSRKMLPKLGSLKHLLI